MPQRDRPVPTRRTAACLQRASALRSPASTLSAAPRRHGAPSASSTPPRRAAIALERVKRARRPAGDRRRRSPRQGVPRHRRSRRCNARSAASRRSPTFPSRSGRARRSVSWASRAAARRRSDGSWWRSRTRPAGSIRFDGEEVTKLSRGDLRRGRRDFQIMFQDPYASLDPRMRVGTILREPLKRAGHRIEDRAVGARRRAAARGRASPRSRSTSTPTNSPVVSASGSASPARSP